MTIFLVILFLLAVITVVGHGIWVLLAALGRALAGGTQTDVPASRRPGGRCPRCGRPLMGKNECLVCGLAAPAFNELGDLEATARQLSVFRQAGVLEEATNTQIQAVIQERRRRLTQPPPALWQRLEELLESAHQVDDFSSAERARAIGRYRALADDQRARLSGGAQVMLARLLVAEGQGYQALDAYRRLLERHPQQFAEIAVEAGRLAAQKQSRAEAEWFFKQALERPLAPESRRQIEGFLQPPRAPAADIPEVIPVEQESAQAAVPLKQAGLAVAPVAASPQPGLPKTPAAATYLRETPTLPTPVPATTPLPAPTPAPPPPPRPPRRSLAEVLAAFMEERNIFWGELVGGLLMVGCSIALVIYLWKDLEQIPYFPFVIFVATTVTLFGAGLYALRRLKLETTSRGLLVIATLLVPLNFLVMAGLSGQQANREAPLEAFRIGMEALALVLFAVLMRPTARVLVGSRESTASPVNGWLLILAVLGISASQLAVPRLLLHGESAPGMVTLLGVLFLACYGTGTAPFLAIQSRKQPFAEAQARNLFAFMGLASFPLIVALGFLAYQSGDLGQALAHLAVIVGAAGIPALTGGLLVHHRLAGASEPGSPSTATLRTGGTAMALAGIAVLLGAVVLAWPQPGPLMAICTIDFLVLTVVAIRGRLPVAHAAALACLTVGYLTAVHFFQGHLDVDRAEAARRLLESLFSAQSGTALVFLVALTGIGAEVLARFGRTTDGAVYFRAGCAQALLSLGLVNWQGLQAPGTAAVIHGVYAAGSLALNLRWRRPAIAYLGLGLLWATTAWTLWWKEAAWTPAWGAAFAVEAALLAVGAVGLSKALFLPGIWRNMAAVCGCLALGLALGTLNASRFHLLTGAALAVTALFLAWSWKLEALSWVASVLILGSLVHAFGWSFPDLSLPHPTVAAWLSHATLVLAASLLWRTGGTSREIFSRPLQQSALASSVIALPWLFLAAWPDMATLCAYLGWLSLVWLVLAWRWQQPVLFAAFQSALTGTVLLGVTAWLENQSWVVGHWPQGLADPRSLQAYGIALALLSLAWLLVRFSLSSRPNAHRLIEPAWPAVDRVVLSQVVIGQLVLAVWAVLPDVILELAPAGTVIDPAIWPAKYPHGHGSGAWLLLGMLVVTLVASLWDRQRREAVFGLVLLTATAPVLMAGRFDAQLAAASALRWGLALCLILASVPIWLRDPLARLAVKLGCAADGTVSPSPLVRRLMLVCLMLPVLALTVAVAVIGFAGQQPAGPAATSFFARIGWVASNIVPLLLVSAALVGHALRERSAGYAFSAGLVLNAAVVGGYALGVVTSGGTLGSAEVVLMLQLGTLVAAVWALAALGSRPWVAAWREDPNAPLAGSLMTLQLGMAVAGNGMVLALAFSLLFALFPAVADWTAAAGSPLGWLALVATVAAVQWRQRERGQPLQGHAVAFLGLTAPGLVACSLARFWPGEAYRVLMFAWAAYAPVLVAIGLLREQFGELNSPNDASGLGSRTNDESYTWLFASLIQAVTPGVVALWVSVVGALTLALVLKSAVFLGEHLPAAAAMAVVSSAGAVMAVWRRREDWAFTAGLGINLAASLLLWHFNFLIPFEQWGVYLLQTNIIATALVSLLWLGLRGRLYGDQELRVSSGPLLAAQVLLAVCGNLVLLLSPAVTLYFRPERSLPGSILPVGQVTGWLALLLTSAAAFWYGDQVAPRLRRSAVVALVLGLGILAACAGSAWDTGGQWLAFHVWLTAWTITGLSVLAAAALAPGYLAAPLPVSRVAGLLCFTPLELRRILTAVGMLVLALALRASAADPGRPYWAAGATLAVSFMAGGVAIRCRQPIYTYFSGLLLNAAGWMAWIAWGPNTIPGIAYVEVICLALGAGVWTVLELALSPYRFAAAENGMHAGENSASGSTGEWLFAQGALALAVLLLVGLIVAALAFDASGQGWRDAPPLPWTALAVTALALGVSFWDRTARFTRAGLYLAGLLAVGLTLHTVDLQSRELGWTSALSLSGFVLVTAALDRLLPAGRKLWQELRLPASPSDWPEGWFYPAQALLGCVVASLSVWLALGFASVPERLAAPAALALLTTGFAVLAGERQGRGPNHLRVAALVLGTMLISAIGWVTLAGPEVPSAWLHRSVVVMMALSLTTLCYATGLPRLLGPGSAWTGCARRTGPVLGAVALAALAAVLAQEALGYDRALPGTRMAAWAIATIAAALVGLIGASLSFAVLPGRDPLGFSERGRMVYVYAAEILLALIFLHFRFTIPWLFHHEFFRRYWPFVVMAIAFAGVGVSEWFERRGLRVLAEPLRQTGIFLPAVPLIAFWAQFGWLTGREPYADYAFRWFLASVLYIWIAMIQRSSRFALVAVLALNAGLWSLLYRGQLDFLVHPQLWLIPLAAIGLLAEHLNRDRLTEQQSGALRYLALLVIYLSSTADMFIAGIGQSVVWPLVLTVLSVAGVLGGILLRVRAFLYLGVTFLFVVVFSMIWHAAVGQGQMWVWWVSGIILGAAIITLFAIFEQRRNDVLRMIEQIKKWD
jgi:hypothetical protein